MTTLDMLDLGKLGTYLPRYLHVESKQGDEKQRRNRQNHQWPLSQFGLYDQASRGPAKYAV